MVAETAFKLYTDGGARGNPGPAAIGIVLVDSSGNIIKQMKRFIGKATNNQAEYTALIEGLKLAKMYWKGPLECFVDSELVARQVNGEYDVKNAELRIAHKAVQKLREIFPSATITHVRRTNVMQSLADKLVNEALDEKE
ncbi:MAG TPA: ribonuclease HI family protein [Candidatus Lokiarchaeia archaeon]|nr:ribonuclease HI family protein [Candidatus Lokiarchaeia archaeon]